MFAISYLRRIQVNNGHKMMYQLISDRFMLLGVVIDVLEILGFLTLFLVIGAFIMAPGGPKGVIKFIRNHQ